MQVTANNYYLNAYAASASYSNGNFNLSGSYLEITGGMSSASKADGVDLSDTVKELTNRLKELDVFKTIFPNDDIRGKAKSLDTISGEFNNDFSGFASMFGKLTSMLGLDSSQTFTMGLDGKGGMTVDGSDKSMTDKLSSFVNNGSSSSQTMIARFAVMAARGALTDAANTVDGFKDAYAQDPFQAIVDNIDALKERLLGFRTEAGNGTMNYGFMRSFSMKFEYSATTASYQTGAPEEAAAAEEAEEAAEVA